ncbi:NAD-dependent epimerase/dehydratase family protein [Myroides guanonis]|uniref:Nucleoside-diphosphate-sugar epimerase n=1 Tax=Myroides guanonis TaxID=1150112 RepID=A0A1I3UQK4_9FLAO|nr:NAD-dependent epimerase/dehydratase family protein [Myroides guanonis]SFJ85320.1 Nucleoside-diphosphate-sugar epimerase [Myroides guanonis]
MILVTGGTGLLGATLLHQLLSNGEEVRAIYRHEDSIKKTLQYFKSVNSEALFLQINWVRADVTDCPALEKAFKDISHVYHCAALISFNPKDEELLRKINIEGTANLVNMSLEFGVTKFCYVSSIAALGDTVKIGELIDEESEWNPDKHHSDYAISKYGAELEVWRGTQEGLDAIIVNPGIIFGNGVFKDGSQEFFTKINKGFPFYTKGIAAIIGVKDVAKSMIYLMKSSVINERFILVAENISYHDLMNEIALKLQKKPPTLQAGTLATSIAWRIDFIISLLTTKKRSFTRSLAKASHSIYYYDNNKAKKELNFTFNSTSEVLTQALSLWQPSSNH